MKINSSNIKFKIFKNHPVVAAFSTRLEGYSEKPFDSMNLGFTRGDDAKIVMKNYQKFCDDIGIDYKNLVISMQKHNDNILIAEQKHSGMGIIRDRDYDDIDALYTEEKNLPIVSVHADCTPIFFFDPVRKAVALAHAGWRGTGKKIVAKLVDVFTDRGSDPADIICAIGPAICVDCYEVGDEILQNFDLKFDKDSDYFFRDVKGGKPHIDLKQINYDILISKGIKSENIEKTELCTKCRSDLFFSHRQHGDARGTQIALMSIL